MKRYKKKAIIIEAEQWFKIGDVPEANIIGWDNSTDYGEVCPKCGRLLRDHGLCPTLEGNHIVCPGDWIIRGIHGEYYPVKPDIFVQTYEPVGVKEE